MATILLPPDFKEFLKLLNSHSVEYLVVGGYAVNYYGYPRSTGGIDIWVRSDATNAGKLRTALAEFGFGQATADLFLAPDTVIRMGVPPVRIEILTSVSGVTFGDCFRNRVEADVDGVVVPFVSFDDLKANKKASGRLKDLADLEELS